MNQVGLTDVYFSKYDEHFCLSKPTWYFKNLFFGGMFVDIGGECTGISMKTGCRFEI
jgi:hypothetical protein